MSLSFLTAGESHGKGFVGIIEGMPAGLPIDLAFIKQQLRRRQFAYGRGARQSIEYDNIDIMAGLYQGTTTGAPLGIILHNQDVWSEQVLQKMPLSKVRPGHGDFAGTQKYGLDDARIISERLSARQTVVTTAIGAICQLALQQLGISIVGQVYQIGKICNDLHQQVCSKQKDIFEIISQQKQKYDSTSTNPVDWLNVQWLQPSTLAQVQQLVDECRQNGETLGGKISLIARGMPQGVGGYSQNNSRLEYDLTANLMSINAVKAVSIGLGSLLGEQNGSEAVDTMQYQNGQVFRKTNYAGGIEGGITNGEDVIVSLTFKPIPSVPKGVQTIDIKSQQNANTNYERGDVTAVFAGQVVAENLFSFVLLKKLLEFCSADTFEQLKQRLTITTK